MSVYDEVEWVRGEAVVCNFKVLPHHSSGGTRENYTNINTILEPSTSSVMRVSTESTFSVKVIPIASLLFSLSGCKGIPPPPPPTHTYIYIFMRLLHKGQAGWYRSNLLDLYTGGTQVKYRPADSIF